MHGVVTLTAYRTHLYKAREGIMELNHTHKAVLSLQFPLSMNMVENQIQTRVISMRQS